MKSFSLYIPFVCRRDGLKVEYFLVLFFEVRTLDSPLRGIEIVVAVAYILDETERYAAERYYDKADGSGCRQADVVAS